MDVFHKNQTNNSIYIYTYTHIINKTCFSELPPEPASAFFGGPDLDIICIYIYIYLF